MNETVDHFAPYESATADSGAYGHINGIGETASGTPACFAQQSDVHIRVEGDRNLKGVAHGADKVEVSPASLGCRGDVSVGGGAEVEIDGAEGPDADARELGFRGLKEIDDRGESDIGSGGRELSGLEIFWT